MNRKSAQKAGSIATLDANSNSLAEKKASPLDLPKFNLPVVVAGLGYSIPTIFLVR